MLLSPVFLAMQLHQYGFHADWRCGTLDTATQRSALVVSWFVSATLDSCDCSSDLTGSCCHQLATDVSVHRTGSLLSVDFGGRN